MIGNWKKVGGYKIVLGILEIIKVHSEQFLISRVKGLF